MLKTKLAIIDEIVMFKNTDKLAMNNSFHDFNDERSQMAVTWKVLVTFLEN